MKTLKETFVIVNLFECGEECITDYLSFNKEELVEKCEELNTKLNNLHKSVAERHNTAHIPHTYFEIKSLNEAITILKNTVADYYIEQGEDY
jgi:hypothetical protein